MLHSSVNDGRLRTAVIGASGGIGSALVDALCDVAAVETVYAASRSSKPHASDKVRSLELDLLDEEKIQASALVCGGSGPLDLVIVASGMLHEAPEIFPEKSWQDITPTRMAKSFAINCTGPAIVAKHFLPLLRSGSRSVFAALSARVGSIGDNRLGGWYAYRASKAALNMMLRSFAIELRRISPESICVGLHPGTVNTPLSAPFRSGVPAEGRFEPALAANQLLAVLAGITPSQSGRVFAWDGTEIEP